MNKIKKLNIMLESATVLNEKQYVRVLKIIKEGYEEALKALKKEYAGHIKSAKKVLGNDSSYKETKNKFIRLYKFEKDKLKLRYFPSYTKARALKYGKRILKHKKPLIATAAVGAVGLGALAYNSHKRHEEAKEKLGLK